MTEKCPVCGKSGLPDYSKIPSVCPQCNSDLNGYFLIGQAQKAIQRKNRVLAGLFLCPGFGVNDLNEKITGLMPELLLISQTSCHDFDNFISDWAYVSTEL